MAATEKTIAGTAPGLRRDAMGLREVLFQSITDMAPGAAIAASIAKMAKRYLGHGASMDGAHERLRDLAGEYRR